MDYADSELRTYGSATGYKIWRQIQDYVTLLTVRLSKQKDLNIVHLNIPTIKLSIAKNKENNIYSHC